MSSSMRHELATGCIHVHGLDVPQMHAENSMACPVALSAPAMRP